MSRDRLVGPWAGLVIAIAASLLLAGLLALLAYGATTALYPDPPSVTSTTG